MNSSFSYMSCWLHHAMGISVEVPKVEVSRVCSFSPLTLLMRATRTKAILESRSKLWKGIALDVGKMRSFQRGAAEESISWVDATDDWLIWSPAMIQVAT